MTEFTGDSKLYRAMCHLLDHIEHYYVYYSVLSMVLSFGCDFDVNHVKLYFATQQALSPSRRAICCYYSFTSTDDVEYNVEALQLIQFISKLSRSWLIYILAKFY